MKHSYEDLQNNELGVEDSNISEPIFAETLHTPGLTGIVFDTGDVDQEEMVHSMRRSPSHLSQFSCIHHKTIRVNRPVCTQKEFDERYVARKRESKPFSFVSWSSEKSKILCQKVQDTAFWRRGFFKYLPCITTARTYDVKGCLVNDLIAGLTVGVMHMPQGMAYAQLANLPPVNGLYTSFFPVLFYCIFGTSRQISMGGIAIVSLLTGTFLDNSNIMLSSSNGNETSVESLNEIKVNYASALAMAVGIIQLIMGVLQLGFLTRYLSDPLISGFTVGASVHVFTSQLKTVFGISIKRHNGAFSIPLTYYEIGRNILQTNVPTICISIIAIVILYIFKEYINPKVRKRIKAPIPIELFIVISGTVASYFLDLNANYHVKIVGDIPRGIPAPTFPNLSLIGSHIGDCISTAVIAFSVCISLSKLFAKKHDYTVDANQELFAYGLSNSFSSFFGCYPAASSLSRSAVQDSMGGKTQMAGVVSCCLLLFVLLLVGPLFKTVPNCCLSSIILVALKGMFTQVEELPILWRQCKWDFLTWIVAALCTIFLDVGYGLVIGVTFSMFSVVFRTQAPSAYMLGRINNTDIYKNLDGYSEIHDMQGVKIFRYEGSLYFACYEHFKETLYKLTGCDPQKVHIESKKLERKIKKTKKNLEKIRRKGSICADGAEDAQNMTLIEGDAPLHVSGDTKFLRKRQKLEEKLNLYTHRLKQLSELNVHHIVIDASTWGYIDHVGILVLTQVIQEYKAIGITVFLANPKTDIREMLDRSHFYNKNDPNIIYVSVHDAVVEALHEHHNMMQQREEEMKDDQCSRISIDENQCRGDADIRC